MSRPGYAFVASLKSCAKLKDAKRGGEIHEEVARTGLLETNLFISSTLIDMYVKCRCIKEAHKLFDCLAFQDIVAWGTMVGGYAISICFYVKILTTRHEVFRLLELRNCKQTYD